MCKNSKYTKILEEELVLALGCTEPIAIAFASALCRKTLGKVPDEIVVRASGNIIKNVQGVIIPGTKTKKGISMAAILGMVINKPERQLEILKGINEKDINSAIELENKGICSVVHAKSVPKLYIEVVMKKECDVALVEVMHQHTNVTRVMLNEERIIYNPCLEEEFNSTLTNRASLSIKGIIDYANEIDINSIKPILKSQMEHNMRIVKEGFNKDYGLSVGKILLKQAHGSMKEKMKAYAASGSDARMSGCDLPVVINSGSGNQGLTIAGPIYIYCREMDVNEERMYRALAVANLIPIHLKTRVGRLAAFCGAVTAAIGVGCALTYLEGGDIMHIEDTIRNSLANLTGVICDGAKPSCAIKIASSVDAAIMAYQLAIENKRVEPGTGIIYERIEDSIQNMANIAHDAMLETDELILKIMTGFHPDELKGNENE